MKFNKIVFTSDILRLTNGVESRDLFAKNTHWLDKVLNRQIHYASQLPIEILEWEKNSIFDGEKVYDLLDIPANVEGWVKFYYQEKIPEAVIDYFAPFLKNAIVIGFEVPPYFMKICSALSLPCINIMWDPIRFMDDIFFCFNTNHPAVFEQLLPYQLSDLMVYQAADLHRARVYRKGNKIEEEGVLVLGQTAIDRSLIVGDQLKKLVDFREQIEALKSKGTLWFKKHPFNLSFEKQKADLEKIGLNFLEKKYPTYDLLCAENIHHVAAISSGTTLEAKFFEKSAQTFIAPYYQHYQKSSQHEENHCVSVQHDFLHANFWVDILSPFCRHTKRQDDKLPFKPNRMRNANYSYWGYEEPKNEQIVLKYD